MTENISQVDAIIADLLSIDPSLAQANLRPMVEKFLAAKPAAEPNDEFRQRLYTILMDEMHNQKTQTQSSAINFNSMNNKFKFTIAALGAAAVLFLVINVLPEEKNVLLSGKQEITKISSNAFGNLATLTSNSRSQSGGGNGNAAPTMTPMTEASEDSKIAPGGMGGGSSDLSYMPVNYKYTYTGNSFTVDFDKMEVYERLGGFGASDLESILSRFDVGLFNISKFADASLDYITASQQKDFGYTLSLDLKQGAVNINENWERWMTPDRMCQDENCYNQYRIKAEDMPSNEAVINIANSFLAEYGIDNSAYGQPVVQDMWRIMYMAATDKSSVYVPDYVQVVYPAKIGDNEVYDQGGNKTGMYVGVNVRQMKVSSLGELTSQRYQGSEYETEQDTARLIKIAETGGGYMYMPFENPEGVRVEEYELGSPTTGFIRMYQNLNGKNRDLYVPGLIFPVINAPAEHYLKYVTVPLIKELLINTSDQPTVRPMGGVGL